MPILERLSQLGEEIELVERDLRNSRRLLTHFWGHLLPVNPAVVGERMRAVEQRIEGMPSCTPGCRGTRFKAGRGSSASLREV